MKNSTGIVLAFISSAFLLTSCEVVGGIFKAGVYTGIFVVVALVGLIIFAVARIGKRD